MKLAGEPCVCGGSILRLTDGERRCLQCGRTPGVIRIGAPLIRDAEDFEAWRPEWRRKAERRQVAL